VQAIQNWTPLAMGAFCDVKMIQKPAALLSVRMTQSIKKDSLEQGAHGLFAGAFQLAEGRLIYETRIARWLNGQSTCLTHNGKIGGFMS